MGNTLNFDRPISRAGTASVKYDLRAAKFGRDDVLPLWVADMDFAAPDCVREALAARAAHPIYGYTLACDGVFDAILAWQERQHGWRIQRDWITLLPGVVPSLALCVRALTRPGEAVVVQPPVYYPFYDVIERNQRRVVRNALVWQNGRHRMDLVQLEAAITPDTRLLLLCSPHNPGGRVWRREELERLGEICLRHDITLVSDEIHADLVFSGHTHQPLAALAPELATHSITLNSPGKTFNIPGLGISYAITPNPKLRARLHATAQALHLEGANLFAYTALEAAYRDGAPWLSRLLTYLAGNIELARATLAQDLPQLGVAGPEATYLLWLDCRAWMGDLDDASLHQRLIAAGLGLSPGVQFGPEGTGFMRMNIALPRSRLQQALARLATLPTG